ncbi:FHA domain-containing protein [Streptomyces odontomachi]|uniref:FHA domain-containing protein n=1 Tax=Streptomyces odontomachi TaxID=2944940 RepID=UPI00210B7CAF|nr:FHA domain-containing protein [Streptomyces sp. ODS25]
MTNRPYSLARDPDRYAVPAPPGTLHVRSVNGYLRVAPERGRIIRFGRGESPEVDLPIGVDDLSVSRQHGELAYQRGKWRLRNTGQLLICLPPGRLMHTTTRPIPLAEGYTALVIKGASGREHLAELYVTGYDSPGFVPVRRASTMRPHVWPLEDDERLLLVALGQDYLRYEENPHPRAYREAADLLNGLQREGLLTSDLWPKGGWTARRIEDKIAAVRKRFNSKAFPYLPLLHDKHSGTYPMDNRYLRNLLKGLVESTTLVPPDLALIGEEPD